LGISLLSELNSFLTFCRDTRQKLILSTFEQYCEKFEPPTIAPPHMSSSTHSHLSTLYRPFYRDLSYPELLTVSESMIAKLNITSDKIQ